MQINIGAKVKKHTEKAKRHHPDVSALEAPAGIFRIEGKNTQSEKSNLKAAVPACQNHCESHVRYNFQIDGHCIKDKPFFVDHEKCKNIETDAEHIEADHRGNIALQKNIEHKDMDEQKTDGHTPGNQFGPLKIHKHNDQPPEIQSLLYKRILQLTRKFNFILMVGS